MRKRVYKVHSVMFSAKEKSAVSLLLYEIPLDRSFSLEIISRSSTILSLQIGQLGSVCIVADNCPIFFFQRCRISCECYILLPLWTYSSNKHVHWKIFSSSLLFFFLFCYFGYCFYFHCIFTFFFFLLFFLWKTWQKQGKTCSSNQKTIFRRRQREYLQSVSEVCFTVLYICNFCKYHQISDTMVSILFYIQISFP